MRTESDKRTVYKTDCSDSISLKNAYKEGKEILAKAGITEADLDAWYLLEFVTGITKARYYMDPDQSMDPEAWEKYKEYLEKRRNHIPLQHITGSQEFSSSLWTKMSADNGLTSKHNINAAPT